MTQTTIEEVAVRMAARQHGVVTRAQLRAEGVGDDVIDLRVRTGRIARIHRGVYLVGAVAPPYAREIAACLACGARAVLSHGSAAALWQIVKAPRSEIVDVIVPDGFRRRPGLRVRRIRTLRADEITHLHWIPVTTAARTLYDLAARLRHRALGRAVAEAIARGLTDAAEVQAMAERWKGRRGAGRLGAVFEGGPPARTRSEAEERFLGLVRQARVNVTIAGYEVDFYWPDARLGVEVDGAAFHGSPLAIERDRRRDARLAAAGIRVMRVTWRQLTREREALLVQLGRALAVGGSGRP